jgi:hypothetical protein
MNIGELTVNRCPSKR